MRAQTLRGFCRTGISPKRGSGTASKPLPGGKLTRASMAAIWRKRRRNALGRSGQRPFDSLSPPAGGGLEVGICSR